MLLGGEFKSYDNYTNKKSVMFGILTFANVDLFHV